MLPQWIIEKKRDGHALSREELEFFIRGYTSGAIPDYQMAALAMAILWRGLLPAETASLTSVMRDSGSIINTAALTGPKIDKHSTGGIGDKTSLIIAPLAAACGLIVPMISGRGLGITGGTLDKLEAIPGLRLQLDEKEFLAILQANGCCIMGQTDKIAPADKKLYALRDVTGTVPSPALITASILSKKLAAGINGLVMDIKVGSGAFMKTLPEALNLANLLIQTGVQAGLQMAALITNMQQPLGRAVGNALEIKEALQTLQGQGPADLQELALQLCARMLQLGKIVPDRPAALALLRRQLDNGAALQKFRDMLKLQNGDIRILDQPEFLPQAPLQEPVLAQHSGFIQTLDAEQIGRACLILGAGRSSVSASIDHAVGLSGLKKIGEQVQAAEPLAIIHARDSHTRDQALDLIAKSYSYSDTPISAPELILQEL